MTHKEIDQQTFEEFLSNHECWLRSAQTKKPPRDVVGGDLRPYDLSGIDLTGADLRDTTIEGVNLEGTKLRNANLRNAILTDANALTAKQLAGADLSGAQLPEDVDLSEGLEHVTELSKHSRNIFIGMIGGCAYAVLTVLTTTDTALFTGAGSTPLPIIQVTVPLAKFYYFAGFVLLALFLYLQLYLQRLWESLASFPARFPDGRRLDERAFPWILSGLVNAHMPQLSDDRPTFWLLQFLLSLATAWALVPISIFLLWFRYLARHDWVGIGLLLIALYLSAFLAFASYRRMHRTIGGHPPARSGLTTWRESGGVLFVGVVAFGFSKVVIDHTHIVAGNPDQQIGWLANQSRAYLVRADISTKPANWTGIAALDLVEADEATREKARAEFRQVRGAWLDGANLRLAWAWEAFFAKARLWDSDFRDAFLIDASFHDAELRRADLRGATLWGTDFRGALLEKVDFRGALLREIRLQRAKLSGAKLTDVNLERADLKCAYLAASEVASGEDLATDKIRPAILTGANLEDADLRGANLLGADMVGANLSGAELDFADVSFVNHHSDIGLSQEQLSQACGTPASPLPPGWEHVPRPGPKDCEPTPDPKKELCPDLP